MLDDFNREGLGIEVDFSLPAERGIRSLDRTIEWRGKPGMIRVDNGPEYISGKLMEWAEKQGVTIQPVQPQRNAYIERYTRTVRHEWLDQYNIESNEEAQDHATQWLWTYNTDRPNIPVMVFMETIAGQLGHRRHHTRPETENCRMSSTNALS